MEDNCKSDLQFLFLIILFTLINGLYPLIKE